MNVEKSNKRKVKSYPELRRLFNLVLIDLNYLTFPKQSKRWYVFLSLIIFISSVFRFSYMAVVSEINDVSFIIGDFTIFLPPILKPKSSAAFIIWTFCAFRVIYIFHQGESNPKLRQWITIGRLLDCHRLSPRLRFVSKVLTKSILIHPWGSGLIIFFCALPSAFYYPFKYWIFLIFWMIVTMVYSLLLASYTYNFNFIYFTSIIEFAETINSISLPLSVTIKSYPICEFDNKVKSKFSGKLSRLSVNYIKRIKKLIVDYQFYNQINTCNHVSSFSMQLICLYLACFVSLPLYTLSAVVVFTINQFLAGQSTHFFISTYGQNKVRNCFDRNVTKFLIVTLNFLFLRLIHFAHN